ncbi:MAG: hypothetical protein GY786_15350 [Proteobacteria bacterium]|nr:hypothetical protein [Pseudomonadota bacterium]
MSQKCSFCNDELQLHQKIFKSDDGKLSHLRCIHQRLGVLQEHGIPDAIIQRVIDSFQVHIPTKTEVIKTGKPWWKRW